MKDHKELKIADSIVTVQYLRDKIKSFVSKRDWEKYHTPRNLAESICIEAAELLEIFQWADTSATVSSSAPDKGNKTAEELADIIIYCLSMANTTEMDVATAVLRKLQINESKYPVDIWKGKAFLR
jgi:dCTP diphosphatase